MWSQTAVKQSGQNSRSASIPGARTQRNKPDSKKKKMKQNKRQSVLKSVMQEDRERKGKAAIAKARGTPYDVLLKRNKYLLHARAKQHEEGVSVLRESKIPGEVIRKSAWLLRPALVEPSMVAPDAWLGVAVCFFARTLSCLVFVLVSPSCFTQMFGLFPRSTAVPLPPPHAFLCLFSFFFFILRRMGKNKALAHHTSTYFHTRRVSI